MAALLLPVSALPAQAEPLLSYVTEPVGRVQWRLWDAATGEDRVFLELPGPVEQTTWDPEARTVTYVAGGGTFRASYDQVPGRPERLGPAPDAPGAVEALWREAGDGRLRAVAIYAVPEADVIETPDSITYRLPDGSVIPGRRDDKWRYFIVCSRQVLSAVGAWSTEAQMADYVSYDGVPCVGLDLSTRREAGVSQFGLHETYRCAPWLEPGPERSKSTLCRDAIPKDRWKAFRAKALPDRHFDFVSLLSTRRARNIAYGVVEGHALHIYDQIFLVGPGEDEIEALALDIDGQLQIGLAPGFLLVARSVEVAEEGTGFDPRVVDLETGEVVFRAEGRDALWVPQ